MDTLTVLAAGQPKRYTIIALVIIEEISYFFNILFKFNDISFTNLMPIIKMIPNELLFFI